MIWLVILILAMILVLLIVGTIIEKKNGPVEQTEEEDTQSGAW